MINRIVRLSFHSHYHDDFIVVFRKHKAKMLSDEICSRLDLLQDLHQPGLFFTHSTWDSEEALDNYRKSEYFTEIWATVKPWFNEKAQAWSLTEI